MKAKEPILVRGHRNGLYITVDASIDTADLPGRIMDRIKNVGPSVRGASVILEVGERTVSDDFLRDLQKRFEREYGLTIGQVITGSDRTRVAAEVLRIRAAPTLHRQEIDTGVSDTRDPDTISVRHTLRSGAVERHLEGNILVMGDVNPGAEVVASGDIIVLGTLRGIVHAGALGDESAKVVALNLQGMQLRIAQCIARSPEGGRSSGIHPEYALVEEGQIVVRDFVGF
ncbi:septum site-determining protein MinC [Candidatus Poribacteria bacterium]|jgi:septum site-determining protein MinC|nr:septum site-determining protein MinC [Candidatus Poribacteria bacterium]MBT5537274.1 septum site-determining protein MinC [Candidatus Poribacteria bacterium]MBT5711091.1 septum site-determining protein MinC [Candidatus Poribacteria bacterium]MBT7101778.1 septum site-determining protein MinC [Candidatus Poribacteria bacterium]MBT7803885.1 septum site-determining protein MinC [Candidatus Poribacteria bacterium]